MLDARTTDICQTRNGLVMRMDDPRLAYNTPPLHVNCRSLLLAATVYDYPDGLLTSHEFDDVAGGKQRDEDVAAVKRVLEGVYKLKVSPQKQARHIAGTAEYARYCKITVEKYGKYPSILYGDVEQAQKLFDEFAGSGKIKFKSGERYPTETIDTRRPIGKYWDLILKQYLETSYLRLKYGRKNVHCYPVWGGDENA